MNNADCNQALLHTIRTLSRPLQPEPTNTPGNWLPAAGIRAVLFDVYGTLFISGAGDISIGHVENDERMARAALTAAGWQEARASDDRPIAQLLEQAIRNAHGRGRQAGIEYPEVDIVAIWNNVLKGLPRSVPGKDITEQRLRRLAVDYEFHVNPVWPMPGLKQTLTALRDRGLVLGLVSNAQFYTPLMFPALLDASLSELGFDLSCCAFSYRMLEAKPSIRLFQRALDALYAQHGIAPDQTLYVGNDMLNDIWPAGQLDCRTVLFAGDRRSLRLRQQDKRCASVKPDHVIHDLRCLQSMLAG